MAALSLEACGNGSGFLHDEDMAELAHFRAKGLLASFPGVGAWWQVHLSGGFAELQLGADDPGFDFGGTGARGIETAGPEVGASLRGLLGVAWSLELIGELRADAAWMPHAPALAAPRSAFQPSAAVTVGLGW